MTIEDLESRLSVVEEEVAELRRELETERVRNDLRISREQAVRGKLVPARDAIEALRQKYKHPVS
jgi:hypothetical protein